MRQEDEGLEGEVRYLANFLLEDATNSLTLMKEIGSDLTLIDKLGESQFTVVWLAKYKQIHTVAVKIVKEGWDDEFLLDEAAILRKLDNERIIRLFGLYMDSNKLKIYLLTETVKDGNLLDFLRSEQSITQSQFDLLNIVFQVSLAMAYLEKQKIAHCDLAARNVLLDGKQIKLADFSLSRSYGTGGKFKALSLRWSAPEILLGGKASNKSDMWSFGVTVYEIFSHGTMPYLKIPCELLLTHILRGLRLSRPEKCPCEIYNVMKHCWQCNPNLRLSFDQVVRILADYINTI